MNLETTSDQYYPGIYKHIKNHVPEFDSVFSDDDPELLYLIVFEFGEFLISKIDNADVNKRCCEFINEALERGGSQTEDVIVTEVFQFFYDDSALLQKVQNNLSTKALIVFDRFA